MCYQQLRGVFSPNLKLVAVQLCIRFGALLVTVKTLKSFSFCYALFSNFSRVSSVLKNWYLLKIVQYLLL